MKKYWVDLKVDCGEEFFTDQFAEQLKAAGCDGHGTSRGEMFVSFCREAESPKDALSQVRRELAQSGIDLPVIEVEIMEDKGGNC